MDHLGIGEGYYLPCVLCVCVYVEKSNQSDGVFLGNWRYVTNFKLLFKINFIYFCI